MEGDVDVGAEGVGVGGKAIYVGLEGVDVGVKAIYVGVEGVDVEVEEQRRVSEEECVD